MDVIRFEDKDGKLKFILEDEDTEPVPVQEEEEQSVKTQKTKEEQ